MIVKDRLRDYRSTIAIGQVTLWTGVLLSQVIVPKIVERWFAASMGDVLAITLYLVSSILIGISIVFHIQGLHMYRRSR